MKHYVIFFLFLIQTLQYAHLRTHQTSERHQAAQSDAIKQLLYNLAYVDWIRLVDLLIRHLPKIWRRICYSLTIT